MVESIHRYFKVGLIPFMAYPSTIRGEDKNVLDVIHKVAVDDYFDAIEINWIKDDELRSKAVKMLETSHLTVCYGGQPRLLTTGLNPNAISEDERKKAEETLMQGIDEAYEMGSKGFAFLAGKYEEDTKEQAYQQLLKTTSNLCSYAKRKDILVELEVFDFDIAKKALIGPAPLAARFAADMRSKHDNFGLMIDLSHIPMCYEKNEFVVRTLRPYLTHFHIGNTVCKNENDEGYGDEHQRFGFPGSSNDMKEVLDFLRVLKNEGFMNSENPVVLSFEVKPWKDEDSDTVVANAKRVLNRAWALLD